MPITLLPIDETAIKNILDMVANSKNEGEFINLIFSEESSKNPTIKHIQTLLMDDPETASGFVDALFAMRPEEDKIEKKKKEKNTQAKSKPKTSAKPHLRIV